MKTKLLTHEEACEWWRANRHISWAVWKLDQLYDSRKVWRVIQDCSREESDGTVKERDET